MLKTAQKIGRRETAWPVLLRWVQSVRSGGVAGEGSREERQTGQRRCLVLTLRMLMIIKDYL